MGQEGGLGRVWVGRVGRVYSVPHLRLGCSLHSPFEQVLFSSHPRLFLFHPSDLVSSGYSLLPPLPTLIVTPGCSLLPPHTLIVIGCSLRRSSSL